MYRKHIWKLLLDVMDANEDSDPFVSTQQTLHCKDIRRALQLMLYIDDNTTPSKQLVLMFFLEFSELDINIDKQFQTNEVKDLMVISDVLVKEFIDDKNKLDDSIDEMYWLFRNLISSVRLNFFALIDCYEKFVNGLAQEDKSLHHHLVKTGIIRVQPNSTAINGAKRDYKKYNISNYRPIITWFVRFYAGIIDHHCLI
ncbi:unnamed protein product, partial [Medioppia subpectinata]